MPSCLWSELEAWQLQRLAASPPWSAGQLFWPWVGVICAAALLKGFGMKICVFCGSSSGNHAAFTEGAALAARSIARSGATLVYGGGRVGLMGVVADAALGVGGEVVGVMPRALVEREIAHRSLNRLHVVETMHERKTTMSALA